MFKKTFIKNLFLFCLISHTASYAMEKEPANETKLIKKFVGDLVDQVFGRLERVNYEKRQLEFKEAKKLPEFTVTDSTLSDPILRITAMHPDNTHRAHQSFLINYSQQNIAYATLLAEPALSALFGNQLAKNYKVLRAAQHGATQQLRRLMEEGANGWHKDKRRMHTIFNLVTREGTLCTKTDIEAGNFVRLVPSNRPIICAFPYSNAKKAYPLMYSMIHNNVNTMKVLIENSSLDESQKQKVYNELSEKQSIIDKEQQALQVAQETGSIPTLSINAACDTMPKPRYLIGSNFNRGMKIQYHIDANQCCIGAKTDRSTWTHPHPDLKTLAFFYTELIANNKHEGKEIVDAFDSWNKKFPILTEHIIGNLLSILETENFDDQQLIPANLISLAQHYIPQLPQSTGVYSEFNLSQKLDSLKELKIKRLLGEVLALNAGRAYDASGNVIDAASKKELDKYMKQLDANPNSKQLFRLTCDANPHLTTILKPAWQQIILREFLTQILSGYSHVEGKESSIVERIVSFWEPDEAFKKGL